MYIATIPSIGCTARSFVQGWHCSFHFGFYYSTPSINATEIAYVKSFANTTACPAQPCLFLNDYARKSNQYFLDNTTFIFLPGNHQLEVRLKFENISSITLRTLEDTSVQVFFGPLVNITWFYCDNIEISGLVFVLSGHSDVGSLFSAIAFQGTVGSLSQLTMLGHDTLLSSAVRADSSVINIHSLTVLGITSVLGAALVASNSTIEFLGHSLFMNNTATDLGGGVMFITDSSFRFVGNVSFLNNVATSISLTFEPFGGAILCYSSVLSFSGSSLFQHNRAGDPHIIIQYVGVGGGLMLQGSSLIFEESSSTVFTGNIAEYQGGALLLLSSELIIHGRALYEAKIAHSGGAILGSSSNVYCNGVSIIFRNNLANYGFGGAISTYSSEVELEGVSFEGNMAQNGGAISFSNNNLHISTCDFNNNTAFFIAGAVYITNGISVLFDGNNNFRWNLAESSTSA